MKLANIINHFKSSKSEDVNNQSRNGNMYVYIYIAGYWHILPSKYGISLAEMVGGLSAQRLDLKAGHFPWGSRLLVVITNGNHPIFPFSSAKSWLFISSSDSSVFRCIKILLLSLLCFFW